MVVNEIFYSLQGEGRWSGTPAVFLRLSGCNLRCSFCDTDHSGGREMTEEEIREAICRYPASHVVITGGEPSLQLTRSLVRLLKTAGKFVQIETNGTRPLGDVAAEIDWITCSPKEGNRPEIERVDELKVVFTGDNIDDIEYLQDAVPAPSCRYLQPCDTGDAQKNESILKSCINFILANPMWALSLQTHKLLDIP